MRSHTTTSGKDTLGNCHTGQVFGRISIRTITTRLPASCHSAASSCKNTISRLPFGEAGRPRVRTFAAFKRQIPDEEVRQFIRFNALSCFLIIMPWWSKSIAIFTMAAPAYVYRYRVEEPSLPSCTVNSMSLHILVVILSLV